MILRQGQGQINFEIYIFKVVILPKSAIFGRIYVALRRAALACSIRAFNFFKVEMLK